MRIDQVMTSGWGLRNNVWLWGDDKEVIIIDACHDAGPILEKVGQRKVPVILLTHAHPDHINVAKPLKDKTGAPIYLHPDDRFMWDKFNQDFEPDFELSDGQVITLGGEKLKVLHTPGHTPGGVCFYWEKGQTLFSGDTLFPGGPGATKWEYSDFQTITDSIQSKLFTLPGETKVLAGHGRPTSIGAESGQIEEWIQRGY